METPKQHRESQNREARLAYAPVRQTDAGIQTDAGKIDMPTTSTNRVRPLGECGLELSPVRDSNDLQPQASDSQPNERGRGESRANEIAATIDQQNFRERTRRSIVNLTDDGSPLFETRQNELSGSWLEIAERLTAVGVDACVVTRLIEDLRQAWPPGSMPEAPRIWKQLVASIQKRVQTTGPMRVDTDVPRVIAMVGPTGVGKTTTIAKLAASQQYIENKRVGLITVDTYRIAAVEQLRTYAEILDVPIEVATTANEMRDAVARLSDRDLIFIDTAGRNPRDQIRIRELRAVLDGAEPDDIYLAISAITSTKTLASILDRFQSVGVSAIVLTKLDETETLCELLPTFLELRLPISYVTHGQHVPDDMRVARSSELASMLLGSRCGESQQQQFDTQLPELVAMEHSHFPLAGGLQ